MGWANVPAVMVSAYIIFGKAAIGNGTENSFSHEVNDLTLELYCAHIASDIAINPSRPDPVLEQYAFHESSTLLYPVISTGLKDWQDAKSKRSELR